MTAVAIRHPVSGRASSSSWAVGRPSCFRTGTGPTGREVSTVEACGMAHQAAPAVQNIPEGFTLPLVAMRGQPSDGAWEQSWGPKSAFSNLCMKKKAPGWHEQPASRGQLSAQGVRPWCLSGRLGPRWLGLMSPPKKQQQTHHGTSGLGGGPFFLTPAATSD